MTSFLLLLACSENNLTFTDKNVLEPEEESPVTETETEVSQDPGDCSVPSIPAEEVGLTDTCPTLPEGGFKPIVEWSYGEGKGCLSMPVVADLNADGMPDILVNLTDMLNAPGILTAISGDGSGELFQVSNAKLAYGSPLSVGDVDNDGDLEIIGVRENEASFFSPGEYSVVAWDHTGQELWESEHFINRDFNAASAPVLMDMDADGTTEIIVGRVILRPDGSIRGVGQHGLGSYGYFDLGEVTMIEGAFPAVTDLDLDGQAEVIVGNAWYDADGNTLFHDPNADDAMIAVANLDDDPEGEIVAVTYSSLRAIDTDGTVMWGPIQFPDPANILSVPTIADVDGDGYPEILTAGGNELRCYNHDGSLLWSANVVDESGATGASVFDFEGDGVADVVYIDEIMMYAFDGPTGGIKFTNNEHSSNTMFDYPVVVDVDADDQAEILVCHNGMSHAFSVYGDLDESWMPARKLWNQHAYTINNINDDYSIPTNPLPSFQHSNTYHSAISPTYLTPDYSNLESEILDICTDECDNGVLWVNVRLKNTGETTIPVGTQLSVYGLEGNVSNLITTLSLSNPIDSGWSSESFLVGIESEMLDDMTGIRIQADDDGTGVGVIIECSELDNIAQSNDAYCP